MPKDYYIVLGVSRGADLKRIKRAYRTLAKRWHPDVSRTGETTDRFLEAKEAYDTLGDAEKRKCYDDELEREGLQIRVTGIQETIRERRAGFERMTSLFSDMDAFFSGFVPGFFEAHRRGVMEKDLYFEAILSPAEAAAGGLYPITVPVVEACPRCTGTGAREDFFCPVCYGHGRVQAERSFSLSIPPGVKHGTEIAVALEDIGMKHVYLYVFVTVRPEWW